jgi:histidinol dehydrogenase
MNCIPAKVSGVERIVVVSPPPIKDVVLAAARVCGVDEVYRVGGAQAVAALAYGTKSIKRVSKIVGPGNKYVTTAKMLVYGTVDVDMPAGPSEIVIIADETANPEYITADLLAQGEHDPDAVCILVTDDSSLPEKIKVDGDQFTAVIVHSTKDAINFVNRFSPEHLEVLTEKAESVCSKVKNAGAVFIG